VIPSIIYGKTHILVYFADREETREERRARRKKSRWGGSEFEKTFIPGMPTILPSNLNRSQERAYLCESHFIAIKENPFQAQNI